MSEEQGRPGQERRKRRQKKRIDRQAERFKRRQERRKKRRAKTTGGITRLNLSSGGPTAKPN
tara:strand:- start:2748 stop:2933 length:186 start_codon:yes stop_codon:yes gene_type:complete